MHTQELWSEKYRPCKFNRLIGSKVTVKKIQTWMKNIKEGNVDKPTLFLHGPPGTGKTTIARILLQEAGYEMVEYNASDVRNQKLVRDIMLKINQSTSVSLTEKKQKHIGIIMDEVDGMSSGDRGGIGEIIQFVRKQKKQDRIQNPLICISNSGGDKKLSELRKLSMLIPVYKPRNNDLVSCAKYIVEKEKIKIELSSLHILATYSQFDYRKMIQNLQELYQLYHPSIITIEKIEQLLETYSRKVIDINIFESTQQIMKSYVSLEKNLQLYSVDRSLTPMMFHENVYQTIYRRKAPNEVKISGLYEIIHSLAMGDMIDRYIYNYQYWSLQEMNGILKCAYPSYRLEQFKKKISASRENSNVAFSSILSKSALQYSSYRYSIQLKNKFSINKSYLHLLDEMLLHLIFSDQMKVCSPYLKHYHIKFTDIDVMAKLHRFCDQGPNYRKMMTTGRKNSLKKWFKSE